MTRTDEILRARAAEGRASRSDVARSEIARARARLDEEDAESGARAARIALATLWGGREWQAGDATGDLYALPAIAPFETLAARLDESADLAALAARTRLAEARLRLAHSGGARRSHDTEDTTDS